MKVFKSFFYICILRHPIFSIRTVCFSQSKMEYDVSNSYISVFRYSDSFVKGFVFFRPLLFLGRLCILYSFSLTVKLTDNCFSCPKLSIMTNRTSDLLPAIGR